MVACTLAGVVNVPIRTLITGYVAPNASTWNFTVGNPWPANILTRVSNAPGITGYNFGHYVDVFYIDANGVGQVRQNFLGTLGGPSLNAGGNCRGAWLNGVYSELNPWLYSLNSQFSTNIDFLSYPLPVSGAVNIPVSSSRRILSISGAGTLNTPNTCLPTLDILETHFQPPSDPTHVHHYGVNRLSGNLIYDTVFPAYGAGRAIITVCPGSGLPGTSRYTFTDAVNTPFNFLANPITVSYQTYPITFDEATIDASLNVLGGWASRSNATIFGWVCYINGAFTVRGQAMSNSLIFITPTGDQYTVLRLVPQDANAVAALAAGNVNRSGTISPDGVLWFQSVHNAGSQDKIFSSFGTTPIIKFLPIFPPQNVPHAAQSPLM